MGHSAEVLLLQNAFGINDSTTTPDFDLGTAGSAVDDLFLGWQANETGVTAVALSEILTSFANIRVKWKTTIWDIRSDDLVALNVLSMGRTPQVQIGGGVASNRTRLFGVQLPLHLPPRPNLNGPYSGKAYFQYITSAASANAAANTKVNSTVARTRAVDPQSWGYKTFLSCVRQDKTPSSTGFGSNVEINRMPGAVALLGVLMFGTTGPAVGSDTSMDFAELRVRINGSLRYDVDFLTYNGFPSTGAVNGLMSATGFVTPSSSFLSNYALITFGSDPPTGSDVVTIDWNAGTADAVRLYPLWAIDPELYTPSG